MRTPNPMIILFAAALLAVGCSPASDPQDGAALPAEAGDVAAPAPAPDEMPVDAPAEVAAVRIEPDTLSNCADPAVVTVHWDVRDSGATQVDLVAVDRRGNEKLFFTGGPSGSRETGAWMRSETQMVLRDGADGRELGRATIAGLPCAAGAPPAAG